MFEEVKKGSPEQTNRWSTKSYTTWHGINPVIHGIFIIWSGAKGADFGVFSLNEFSLARCFETCAGILHASPGYVFFQNSKLDWFKNALFEGLCGPTSWSLVLILEELQQSSKSDGNRKIQVLAQKTHVSRYAGTNRPSFSWGDYCRLPFVQSSCVLVPDHFFHHWQDWWVSALILHFASQRHAILVRWISAGCLVFGAMSKGSPLGVLKASKDCEGHTDRKVWWNNVGKSSSFFNEHLSISCVIGKKVQLVYIIFVYVMCMIWMSFRIVCIYQWKKSELVTFRRVLCSLFPRLFSC